jgi:ubiquinone/menaquinone biosynthesis C-methylase UbiE
MSPEKAEHYVGTELQLFAHAKRWKSYFASKISPHLGRDVAEVGAGIGGTTALLSPGHRGRWLCLEPDQRLLASVRTAIAAGTLPAVCEALAGTLSQLPAHESFDSILYIDVLEHIEDDQAETREAARRLRSGGKLIVLAPAHQWLYSPFDQAIGHFRRYDRRSLSAAIPSQLRLVELAYLDSVGLLASAGNRFISRQSSPSFGQIRLWDSVMVPLSRLLDPLTRYRAGKSLLGVWQKP